MTEEELTAIEARANAATREPWVVGDAYVPTASLSAVSVYGMGMEVAECQMPADGTFIAAARVDVPALVAEVRRLRAELGAAYGHDYAKANPDAYTALHDALIVAEGQRDQAKLRAEKAEAERDALRKACEALPKAMDRAMNYIAWEVSVCNGLKCREGHCASCCGDEAAEAWVAEARASYADLEHAAAALDAALAVQPTTSTGETQ